MNSAQQQAFSSGAGGLTDAALASLWTALVVAVATLFAAWTVLNLFREWRASGAELGEAGFAAVRVGILVTLLAWILR